MLSNLQIASFQLHSMVFFYLPPLPFPLKSIQDTKHIFVVTSSKVVWLSNIFLFCLMLLHAVMWGSGAGYWGFVLHPQRINNVTIACFGAISFTYTAAATLAFSVFLRIHAITSSANAFIGLETDLKEKTGVKEPTRYDIVMLITVILAGMGPICTVPGTIYLDLDVLKYIIDDFFSNPYYRDGTTILLIVLFRAGFLFVSTIEFWRSGSYFVLGLLLGIDQATKVLHNLERIPSNTFPHYYNMLNLIYSKFRCWFEWFFQGIYGASFWGTVFLATVLMTCWNTIEITLYIGVAITTVVFVVPHAYVLPLCIDALQTAKDLVWYHRLKLNFIHAKKLKIGSFRMKKVGKAIKPIAVKCGSFRELNHDFLVEHFEQMCSRLFDIIMFS